MKKFDKTAGWKASKAFEQTKLRPQYFMTSTVLKDLTVETEELYINTFEKGHRRRGMAKLRIPDLKNQVYYCLSKGRIEIHIVSQIFNRNISCHDLDSPQDFGQDWNLFGTRSSTNGPGTTIGLLPGDPSRYSVLGQFAAGLCGSLPDHSIWLSLWYQHESVVHEQDQLQVHL